MSSAHEFVIRTEIVVALALAGFVPSCSNDDDRARREPGRDTDGGAEGGANRNDASSAGQADSGRVTKDAEVTSDGQGLSCRAPGLPPLDPSYVLGAAGAPIELFGPESSPDFDSAFTSLAGDGFNAFVPVFLTSENGEGSTHGSYFLQAFPDLGLPLSTSCESAFNPFAAGPPGFEIVMSAHLLVADQSEAAHLDMPLAESRLRGFVERCLSNAPSRLGGWTLYDEPANRYLASTIDAEPGTFVLENVFALAEAARTAADVDLLLVEAATAYGLPFFGVTEPQLTTYREVFWDAVDQIAGAADVYGFDLYLVDLDPDFTPIAEHTDHIERVAPAAVPIMVLQGFGLADMELDLGTSGRAPTRDETRAMAFTAAAGEVRGIYWFGQSAVPLDAPVWADVREVARDLRELSGVFALPRGAGSGHQGSASVLVKEAENGAFVVLANRAASPVTVAIPELATGCAADALSGEAVDAGASGTFRYELAGYETRVIAVSSD